jgi:hypothetical protein
MSLIKADYCLKITTTQARSRCLIFTSAGTAANQIILKLLRYLESGAVPHLLVAHAQQEREVLVLDLWVPGDKPYHHILLVTSLLFALPYLSWTGNSYFDIIQFCELQYEYTKFSSTVVSYKVSINTVWI